VFLEELKVNLKEIIGNKDRPVAVFSALWPLLRASKLSGKELSKEILSILNEILDGRTLLMPAFASGFKDGVCNLDNDPSYTGALSEYFRMQPGTRRTVCPFFSFAVNGTDSEELVELCPKDAWGRGSLYDWMYDNDVKIVTIGTHPTHCSFSHYAEWVMRDLISYRYSKEFSGSVIHEGRKFDVNFNMFVRRLEPMAINDFTWLLKKYKENGMQHRTVEGVSISSMNSKRKIDLITGMIEKDPLVLVKNREDFEGMVKNE